MPTTASSNYPHVRITRNTHEKVRFLAFVLKIRQGDLIDLLATEKLAALGNPTIVLTPRQAPEEEPVPANKRRREKPSSPAPPPSKTRARTAA